MEDEKDGLTSLLGELAFDLQDRSDPESTLRFIVEGAVRLVPGANWAGISMINGCRVDARVPSDPLVAILDQLQSELNEGPCVEALRQHHTVRIDDMTTDPRWSRFTAAARRLGVASSLSFQLFVRKSNFGALNLYADQPFVFDEESQFVGSVLAQHASVAMAASEADGHWRTAIDSRDLIGQAKGLLMQRNGVTGLHAFTMLVTVSQQQNMKLVDVARWLVERHNSSAISAPRSPA